MLVRVTERCRMGCSHCMVEATPEGRHMDRGTFREVLEFCLDLDGMILISGGEPMEHPEILEILREAQAIVPTVFLLSNGMFLEDPAIWKEVRDLGVLVQVTNDPRYYPRTVPVVDHPNLSYEHHLQSMMPLGRAVGRYASTRMGPACFNLRALARSRAVGWRGALRQLRGFGKYCVPSVDVDGTLRAGETPLCAALGTFRSPDAELTEALLAMRCSRCGLVNNLDFAQRRAIGEL